MRHYYYTDTKNGLDITCEVCGKTEYLPRIREHMYFNGRLIPDVYFGEKERWTRVGDKDVCKDCNKTIDKFNEIPN